MVVLLTLWTGSHKQECTRNTREDVQKCQHARTRITHVGSLWTIWCVPRRCVRACAPASTHTPWKVYGGAGAVLDRLGVLELEVARKPLRELRREILGLDELRIPKYGSICARTD